MKNVFFITCCVSLIAIGCGKKPGHPQYWTFHTTPDKWKEPRIYQESFDDIHRLNILHRAGRIITERVPAVDIASEKTISPNGAYWFCIQQPDPSKPEQYDTTITIYNERDYLTKIKMPDLYNNYKPDAKWITEKLIYIRAWWGRIFGVDLIFDVESENIIYQEYVVYGGTEYEQWQQAMTENKMQGGL